MMARTGLGFLLLAALAAGCSTYGPNVTQCNVGADCASGQCRADGTCVPVSTGTGGAGGSTTGSQGGGGTTTTSDTSSTTTSSSSSTTSGGPGCVPNNDGTITRAELPLAVGLKATYTVWDDVTWDPTAKAPWNPTTLTGGHTMVVNTDDPTNAWYTQPITGNAKPCAATATNSVWYAARMSDQNPDLLGIFELTDTQLLMLCVASKLGAPTNPSPTQLIYNPPVTVMKLPFKMGDTWSTLSAVTGTLQGIGIAGVYNEQYDGKVDGSGVLHTGYADFQSLRISTDLLRFLNGLWTTKHTVSFVTECFSTVGSAISPDSTGFPSASEVWALSK
jgi:hypothetical protein